MAVSKNTKKQYNNSNAAYKEDNALAQQKKSLLSTSNNAPVYQNSYANQLDDMFNKIKSNQNFDYDPRNDAAYRRFADEYNALSGLAIAGNQQQAQDLTGGFGSTYAPEVAQQGLASLKENAANAQPYFLENAQEAYKAENDRLKNMYQATADARNDELDAYYKKASLFNDNYKDAAQKYSDARNFNYNSYNDNRSFWAKQYDMEQSQANKDKQYKQTEKDNQRDYTLKSYSVYQQLAETKAYKYNKNKNNSGLKSYLKGLVKSGKITQYMADNIYDKYKYTAPKTTGSGRHTSGSGGKYTKKYDDTNTPPKNWKPDENILKTINLSCRSEKPSVLNNERAERINDMYKSGNITEEEANYYLYYYGLNITISEIKK